MNPRRWDKFSKKLWKAKNKKFIFKNVVIAICIFISIILFSSSLTFVFYSLSENTQFNKKKLDINFFKTWNWKNYLHLNESNNSLIIDATRRYEQHFVDKEFHKYWTKKNFGLFYDLIKYDSKNFELQLYKKYKSHRLNINDLYDESNNLIYNDLHLDISVKIKPLKYTYYLNDNKKIKLELTNRFIYFHLFNTFKELFLNPLIINSENLNLNSAYINDNLMFYLKQNQNQIDSSYLYNFFNTQWNDFKENEKQEFSIDKNQNYKHLFDYVIVRITNPLEIPLLIKNAYFYQRKESDQDNFKKLQNFLSYLKTIYLPRNKSKILTPTKNFYLLIQFPKVFNIFEYLKQSGPITDKYINKLVSLRVSPNYNLPFKINVKNPKKPIFDPSTLNFLSFQFEKKPQLLNNVLNPNMLSLHYLKKAFDSKYDNETLFDNEVGNYLRNCLNESLKFSFKQNNITNIIPTIENCFQNVKSNASLLKKCYFLTNDHEHMFSFADDNKTILKNLKQFRVIYFNLTPKQKYQNLKNPWNWKGIINFNIKIK